MTISTYAELKTAIGTYMGRSDLTDRADEFIDNLEAKITRRLRVGPMETTVTGACVADTPTVALPTGYIEMRSFTYDITTDSPRKLEFITPEQGDALEYSSSGSPMFYSVVGGAIRLYPTPDEAYAYTIRYFASFAPLSASNTTNSLLTNYPDLYLYGSLLEACGYSGDDGRIPLWKAAVEECYSEISRHDRRARHKPAVVQLDPALVGIVSRLDITTDGH